MRSAQLLLGATVLALLWANSPWADTYGALFDHTTVVVGVEGTLQLRKSLLAWINHGLMGVFFFSVGLEIKRELIGGELASWRSVALPAASAIGGMLTPALIYVAIAGTNAPRGWGVPMATDIAFALGVLGLVSRVPRGLEVFLTALAIVDDIGAIIVIALFYTEGLSLVALGVGLAALGACIAANRAGVRHPSAYFVLGLVVWVAFVKSGVHATLAAVLVAFTVPARTRIDARRVHDRLRKLLERSERESLASDATLPTREAQELYDTMDDTLALAVSPLHELEQAIAPIVVFVVLPLFALANAGVSLAGGAAALAEPAALGAACGLLVGKPLGITLFGWLAVRLGLAELPQGTGWLHFGGVGFIAGVGFTMALFIAALAFGGSARHDAVKLAVLAASTLSAVLGVALTYAACRGGR